MKPLKKMSSGFFKLLTILIVLNGLASYRASAQSMGISSSAITPDASSILEMRTTTKGLLIPRMTTTERDAISSPANGLIVYNTSTSKFNFYNGSAWVVLFAGTSGVNSITGTTNRITIGGTAADPTVDISSGYVGQSSITTLGTIGTGVWNGTLIGTGYGGTGTATTLTQGSLVFAGASGVYSQNNTKLFWDNTNFRLGIGTASPNSGIQVGSLTNGGTDNIIIGGAASPGFMLNTLGTDFGTFYSTAANTVGIGFSSTVAVPSLAVFKVNKTGAATFGTSVATDDNIILQPYTGGSNSFAGTITTADLTAARTYTLPDANGTLATLAGTETFTNKTISGASNTLTNISMSSLTGILGSANGGTGNGFTKFSGPATAEKTFTLPNASATILTDNTAVTVAQGGTGTATLASNGVLYGNGTGAIQALPVNSTGTVQYLSQVSSGTPTWVTPTNGTVTSVSGTTNRITVATGTTTPVIDISSSYVGQNSITTLGTIGTGTWNGSLINPTYGGTGVNNGSSTITLGGNLITSGAFATTLTSTGTTNATLPSGTNTLYSTKASSISSAQLLSSLSDPTGTGVAVFGTTPTLGTPVINGLATGTGVASAATASTLASRDANANLTANNHIQGYTTTATAAGTTTLTVGSTYLQFFTGSTTQTVTLPVASTLVLGQQFFIVNNSTGVVTVQSSGANTVQAMVGSSVAKITCILTSGTGTASWSVAYVPPFASANTASTAVFRDASGNFSAGTITATISGNTSTATALATGRTIGMTGDVTWTSPAFDGSGNVTAAATVTRINGTALSGLATGILKNTTTTGVPSIAVPADFPTLNQNTTGSAATLTTSRNIYGNAFNGSADITGIIASTYGGTGNGFSKFSGATTSEKTYTLPDASTTILTKNYTGALATGIVKNTTSTGDLTIAVPADFPTLNQNTTGSAATLTTARNIYGNSFNGSADLTQIIASTYGGTGNGFTKFTGPATAEKTFTLPNASATILTDNAVITAAQGGTGQSTYTTGDLLYASSSSALSKLNAVAAGSFLRSAGTSTAPVWSTTTLPNSATTGDLLYASASNTYTNLTGVATGNALISGGTSTAPSWGKIGLTTHVSGTLPIANGGTNSTATPTNGGIVYGDGSSHQVTAAGTTGQVLKSTGAGTPTWDNAVTIVTLGSDVTNSNATANTIADVTGLSFSVTAGVTYNFHAMIIYTAAATTTGSRWAINGPASPTLISYTTQNALTTTTNTNINSNAYDLPAASNASSAFTSGNIALIDGIIKPSANGTVIVRFASEIASSAIVAKAGSTITWW